MGIDRAHINWDDLILSHEETVLFMVTNFQYLITCLAFSIAEPFRKPMWTNYPFLFCVCLAFTLDCLIIFSPDDSILAVWFNLLPFATANGISYYSYRYQIGLGVLLNSILTYTAEKVIVNQVTQYFDA